VENKYVIINKYVKSIGLRNTITRWLLDRLDGRVVTANNKYVTYTKYTVSGKIAPQYGVLGPYNSVRTDLSVLLFCLKFYTTHTVKKSKRTAILLQRNKQRCQFCSHLKYSNDDSIVLLQDLRHVGLVQRRQRLVCVHKSL